MFSNFTRQARFGALVAVALMAAACSPKSGDYLAVKGGSFIFNYRLAEITAGFAAGVLRELPQGTVLEATFEDPAGGPPIVIKKDLVPGQKEYDFTTPKITGVVKDKPYAVTLVARDPAGKELQKIDMVFKSDVDGSVMPDAPLTVGPGYTRPDHVKPPEGAPAN